MRAAWKDTRNETVQTTPVGAARGAEETMNLSAETPYLYLLTEALDNRCSPSVNIGFFNEWPGIGVSWDGSHPYLAFGFDSIADAKTFIAKMTDATRER